MSRKAQPNADTANLGSSEAGQQKKGNWHNSMFQQRYGQLIPADEMCKFGGFKERAEYYIPRGDLLPNDFKELEESGK